jgi:hypothetical protein
LIPSIANACFTSDEFLFFIFPSCCQTQKSTFLQHRHCNLAAKPAAEFCKVAGLPSLESRIHLFVASREDDLGATHSFVGNSLFEILVLGSPNALLVNHATEISIAPTRASIIVAKG